MIGLDPHMGAAVGWKPYEAWDAGDDGPSLPVERDVGGRPDRLHQPDRRRYAGVRQADMLRPHPELDLAAGSEAVVRREGNIQGADPAGGPLLAGDDGAGRKLHARIADEA